ncbi:hypothetical protein IMZ08_17415 [Bacillus luteolus]|uniref:Integral membrane protein n=1 Tax=Litchfieldia luteola TaxID=682179 RepID=A0ABR9QMV4_9BACI|nr:hypothetical protein [Cytobacillus luteolus]MBE4909816.1 hypothetical protein [Cytobacillus luteolus]MBP1942635.1 hypothetical protein [Cytobacillus luteolus]
MGFDLSTVAAIAASIILVGIAVFQVLLALGFPFGEAAMGGYHRVLPKKLRVVSVLNGLILIFMAYVFLEHAEVFTFNYFTTTIFVWIFTVFLALNTIGNFVSRSKKEKYIMTPLSSIAFILCLIVVLF